MAEDLIRYDVLAQEALRGVVRRVLIEAGKDGLPGEHHFFIAFDVRHPGVRISDRLREKHKEEMTIVVQHQFWDLNVTETTFEIGLSFGNVPERLLVPFAAVKGFFDPSVQFGLQFDVAIEGSNAEDAPAGGAAVPSTAGSLAPVTALETKSGGARAAVDAKAAKAQAGDADADADDGKTEDKDAKGEVVSLDAFRKKN